MAQPLQACKVVREWYLTVQKGGIMKVKLKDLHNSPLSYPEVCRDLVYVLTDSNHYIVEDTKNGRHFRLKSEIVLIMQRLDGSNAPETVSSELGLQLTVIKYVVEQLEQLHLFETKRTLRHGREYWKIRPQTVFAWFNHLFLIRKNITYSDRWIEATYRFLRLKYIFKSWFIIVLLVMYLAALVVSYYYSSVLESAVSELFKGSNYVLERVLLFYALYLVIGTFHELGHALSCKHFGGKVRSMGVALYYFQPAFYTDVSDAWMFTQRHQRLITHAAGLIVNFLIASLALFLLPFAVHLPWLKETIAMIFLISGVYALINFNPLIQLDGYYLLADALNIQNMRKNAFDLLYSRIRHILDKGGIVKYHTSQRHPQYTKREKYILPIYALLSFTYKLLLSWFLGSYYTALLLHAQGLWSWLFFCVFFTLFTIFPFLNWWKTDSAKRHQIQKYAERVT